jgi:hypothetical protein
LEWPEWPNVQTQSLCHWFLGLSHFLKGLPSKRASSPPSIGACSLSDNIQYGTYQPQRGAYLKIVSQQEKMEIISGKAVAVKFEIALAKPQNFRN